MSNNRDYLLEKTENDSKAFAEAICSLLELQQQSSRLWRIYVPFFATVNYLRTQTDLSEIIFDKPPRILMDLLNRVFGTEGTLVHKYPSEYLFYKFPSSDLALSWSPNRFERFVFFLYRLSWGVVRVDRNEFSELSEFQVNHKLRDLLRNHLSASGEGSFLADLLPISLLEQVDIRLSRLCKITSPKSIFLGEVFNEDYLYQFNSAVCRGAIVYGEPHGGCYFQTKIPSPMEITERVLCDVYPTPDRHSKDIQVNIRASRSAYIVCLGRLTAKLSHGFAGNRLLVVLPIFFMQDLAPGYAKTLVPNEIYLKVIREIQMEFRGKIVFRPHPRQDRTELIKVFRKEGLELELSAGKQLLQIEATRYKNVLLLDTTGTAIVELRFLKAPLIVFVPKINSLCTDFVRNLRSGKRFAGLKSIHGSFHQLTRAIYTGPLGVKLTYAFDYARLFRKLCYQRVDREGTIA
jgi:hypothetical protein